MVYEETILKALENELRIINKHLPYRRLSLKKLLSMEIPYIVLRDGTRHLFRRKELLMLKELVDSSELDKLLIPIIIEINPSYGEGSAIIRDPLAAKVVSKILDIEYRGSPLILYRPQLFELRSVLRTTTTIMFIPG